MFSISDLVHHDIFSMVFQPNNVNPNEPLSLLKSHAIIKRILNPYDLEFIETYNYFYWKGNFFFMMMMLN